MSNMQYDHMLKLLLIGDSGVGKTCLLLSFVADEFADGSKATIGVDLKVKTVELGGKILKLTIWDTAGQERFRTLTSAYYRGAQGVILVYDVSVRETFDHVQNWMKEANTYSTKDKMVTMLVANKKDLPDHAVSSSEGRDFARRNNLLFIETSAKTKLGVQQAFEELVLKILQEPSLLENEAPPVGVTSSFAQQDDCAC
eukprot:205778_1